MVTELPTFRAEMSSTRSSPFLMWRPSILTRMSPGFRPALAAPPFGTTELTMTPPLENP